MSVQPRVLGHRILLKPLEANETTAGGVVLPDETRGKETRGIVLGVGDRCGDQACPCHYQDRFREGDDEYESPVSIGDVVVYAEDGMRTWGKPIRVSVDTAEAGIAEELVVLDFADLLLVLEEANVPA